MVKFIHEFDGGEQAGVMTMRISPEDHVTEDGVKTTLLFLKSHMQTDFEDHRLVSEES